MLHTVILFFWLVKTKFEGRIGRITLGEGPEPAVDFQVIECCVLLNFKMFVRR